MCTCGPAGYRLAAGLNFSFSFWRPAAAATSLYSYIYSYIHIYNIILYITKSPKPSIPFSCSFFYRVFFIHHNELTGRVSLSLPPVRLVAFRLHCVPFQCQAGEQVVIPHLFIFLTAFRALGTQTKQLKHQQQGWLRVLPHTSRWPIASLLLLYSSFFTFSFS